MNEASDSKFVTRKWNMVNYQSNENYDSRNEIIYDTQELNSNLFYYNDVYVQVAVKNCAPFAKRITKNNGTTIDDAEDLDFVIPIYSLL